MRYETLEEAIQIVNGTGYGLTSAIHSLDDREVSVWRQKILAGNLYINRGTTGAIVLRQPFGGMGKSCFGPGIKAGGPNYVAQFMHFKDVPSPVSMATLTHADAVSLLKAAERHLSPQDAAELRRAFISYENAWNAEFSQQHDHFRLVGQDNLRRYLPFETLTVRIVAGDLLNDVLRCIVAARMTGARVMASFAPEADSQIQQHIDLWTDPWGARLEVSTETDASLADSILSGDVERIRYLSAAAVPQALRHAAAQASIYIADQPVLSCGRIELLWYLREQSISHDYHRYGNLGNRSSEIRKPVA
jgi:RHH-type proline utilization regulon transcriptional repressor/proline dehydrogenase/delta 1-pyrroline-5-carboxylate dehydrogenase